MSPAFATMIAAAQTWAGKFNSLWQEDLWHRNMLGRGRPRIGAHCQQRGPAWIAQDRARKKKARKSARVARRRNRS